MNRSMAIWHSSAARPSEILSSRYSSRASSGTASDLNPVMKRHVVARREFHEPLDGHLAQFRGPPQRDLVFPVQFQGEQRDGLRREVLKTPSSRADKVFRNLDANGLHASNVLPICAGSSTNIRECPPAESAAPRRYCPDTRRWCWPQSPHRSARTPP